MNARTQMRNFIHFAKGFTEKPRILDTNDLLDWLNAATREATMARQQKLINKDLAKEVCDSIDPMCRQTMKYMRNEIRSLPYSEWHKTLSDLLYTIDGGRDLTTAAVVFNPSLLDSLGDQS